MIRRAWFVELQPGVDRWMVALRWVLFGRAIRFGDRPRLEDGPMRSCRAALRLCDELNEQRDTIARRNA